MGSRRAGSAGATRGGIINTGAAITVGTGLAITHLRTSIGAEILCHLTEVETGIRMGIAGSVGSDPGGGTGCCWIIAAIRIQAPGDAITAADRRFRNFGRTCHTVAPFRIGQNSILASGCAVTVVADVASGWTTAIPIDTRSNH
ncbi:MAG: hypothetical protein HYY44_00310 [Deltaproteobacteria bacterium]|nr:hypothetical protein [Deltaproteobacteria bacterium]